MAGMPSEGAAQKAWAVFRSILGKAMRWGLIECDPTIQMKPPHTNRIPAGGPRCQTDPPIPLELLWPPPLEAWLICSVTLGLRTEETAVFFGGGGERDINLTA